MGREWSSLVPAEGSLGRVGMFNPWYSRGLSDGYFISSLAMAAAFQGSNMELYITDQEPMIDLMKRNTELNGLAEKVKVELLNWGEPIPTSIARAPVDIILAADCVYFEPAFPLLEQTLWVLLNYSK